jgi:hypothetical protein
LAIAIAPAAVLRRQRLMRNAVPLDVVRSARRIPMLLEFLAKLFRLDRNPKMVVPVNGTPTYEQVTSPRV